jgi:hypothetical protein
LSTAIWKEKLINRVYKKTAHLFQIFSQDNGFQEKKFGDIYYQLEN